MTQGEPLAVIELEDRELLARRARSLELVAVDDVVRMAPADRAGLVIDALAPLDRAIESVSVALDVSGMCLLRGLPVTDVVLALVGSSIGELVPATERPVGYLEDIAPAEGVDAGDRPHSRRRSALLPHTDQSARGTPPDFLVLACVANDVDDGGKSILVPAAPVVEHLRERDPEAVDLLQDPVFPLFNVPKRDCAVTAPLVTIESRPRATGIRTRFRDEAVRAGLAEMHRPSDAHVAAFEMLSSAYHDPAWWVVRHLEPGDALCFDNTRVLHGRTAMHGGQHRHLKRLNGRFGGARRQRRLGARSSGVRP